MTAADWAELTGKWFLAVEDTWLRQTTWRQIEPHRDYIDTILKAGGDSDHDLAAAARIGPPFGHQAPVPAQDRVR